jgi:sporulation protein YlmC with PRC-barrel domain
MTQNIWDKEKIHRFQEIEGEEIFDQRGDVSFGVVEDLLVDPNLLEVAAIVIEQDKALVRDNQLVTSVYAKEQENDSILLSTAIGVKKLDYFSDCEEWISVANDLIGSDVRTNSGINYGELIDVAIGKHGKIVEYELNDIAGDRLKASKQKTIFIPGQFAHSIGSGLLIINARIVL